jgi:hypothetical protein
MKLKDQAKRQAFAQKMLDTEQAAKFLGYTTHALKKWRVDGKGPIYYKLAGGLVYYKRKDLIRFQKLEIVPVQVVPEPKPKEEATA